jgi:hypothetical protein
MARNSVTRHMEETMRNQRITETDSIQELAAFWDTHDLTNFEDQSEEVAEPIFVRCKRTIAEIILEWKDLRDRRMIQVVCRFKEDCHLIIVTAYVTE